MKLKICAISDTHNRYSKLVIPPCEILISAGDYSSMGYKHEVQEFHKWLNKQPATHKISVQGNHELWVEKNFLEAKQIAEEECPGVYFIDEGPIEIEGIKIWCSAITPFFMDWAWNRHHGEDIQRHWDRIPEDTQILVTHGPSYGILDTVKEGAPNLGCYQLKERIKSLKDLEIHICGHIHGGYGQKHENSVSYYNSSICDEKYYPANPITEIDYER